MNLYSALADYLELRRGHGFSLNRDAKLLAQFLTYLDEQGSSTVTVAHALTWSSLPRTGSPSWLSFRMYVVRGFATYLRTLDPCTEVPSARLATGRASPGGAVPVLRHRHSRAVHRDGAVAHTDANSHDPNLHRGDGGDGHAWW